MEGVKRNADRKKNIEMWRLIDDADAREQPLKILEQEISVLKEAEHAEIHANASDEPSLLTMSILRSADLAAKPEIHRRCREQQCGKWRIPRAVENVACHDEQIFAQVPPVEAPVERGDDDVKNYEGERIKKHDESGFELNGREGSPIYVSHIAANI
jgi:hypothetical protein